MLVYLSYNADFLTSSQSLLQFHEMGDGQLTTGRLENPPFHYDFPKVSKAGGYRGDERGVDLFTFCSLPPGMDHGGLFVAIRYWTVISDSTRD